MEIKWIHRKTYENSGIAHSAEINQALFPNSMLQYIGRVASSFEAEAKKLHQIVANNIDNGWRGIDLRIYVRYFSLSFSKDHNFSNSVIGQNDSVGNHSFMLYIFFLTQIF